jgi:large subunit ribosomal protein L22
MIAKAELRFTRGSARKIRRVIDSIRGLDVNQAFSVLATIDQRPKTMVKKLLNSAISNAKHKGLKEDNLYISKIVADEAGSWKRFRAAAFGRATEILKRTSHVKIELDLREVSKEKTNIAPKTRKPRKAKEVKV